MAEFASSSDNIIESLLSHIAENSRMSSEQFEEVVEKLKDLLKAQEAYADNMEDTLRKAIDEQLKSTNILRKFASDDDKTKGLSRDAVFTTIKKALLELVGNKPELFRTSGDTDAIKAINELREEIKKLNEINKLKNEAGALVAGMFGPTGGNQNQSQNNIFKNLFNIFQKPNADDEDRKSNKFLNGIKLFFTSRSFLGKLGATILDAILDSKFIKGGLKDLFMVGVLLLSSWVKKHFGPVVAGVTFLTATALPGILGLLGGILKLIGAFKAAQFGWNIAKTVGQVIMSFILGRTIGGGLQRGLIAQSAMLGLPMKGVKPNTSTVIDLGEAVPGKDGVLRAGFNKGASGWAGKAIGVAGKAPVLAGAFDTGASLLSGDSVGRSLSGGVGAGLGTWAGLAGSTALMAALGISGGWIPLVAGLLLAGLGSSIGSSLGKGTFDSITSMQGSNQSGLPSNNSKSSWMSNLLWTNWASEIGKGLNKSIFSSGEPNITEKPNSIGNRIDKTNVLLTNILTVLKYKANYGNFGFSNVQTDIEGNPIGFWNKVGGWISNITSSFTGGNNTLATPSGHSNTYMSEGSFGGHSIKSAYKATEAFRKNPHGGIDLAYSGGDAVGAKVAGTVKFADAGNPKDPDSNGGFGGLVIINDDKGNDHYYGHLSAVNVERGQKVGQGTIIGLAGSTGRSTGPHLHYEVRVNPTNEKFTGTSTDPMAYAKSMGYDKKAEEAVFQAEENYNLSKSTGKKTTGSDSKASNESFKKKVNDSYTKVEVQGITIIGK